MNELEGADLRVLLQVYQMNARTVQMGMPVDTPFLYSGNSWKRARALCESGLLKLHDVGLSPPSERLVPVTITPAGIEAYNAAIAKMEAKT